MQAAAPMRTIATDVQFIEADGTTRPATTEEAEAHLRQITDPRPTMGKPITFATAPETFVCDHCDRQAAGQQLEHPKIFAAYQLPPGWWVFFDGDEPKFLCSEACARVVSGESAPSAT
ncbi:MAG: hypothetical protein EKK55_07710 [Rhodocyclaceae bacterium]|nr:MAG: hypothetical protein EKK55_07710 [Rhodocyclaceae bacterium]